MNIVEITDRIDEINDAIHEIERSSTGSIIETSKDDEKINKLEEERERLVEQAREKIEEEVENIESDIERIERISSGNRDDRARGMIDIMKLQEEIENLNEILKDIK